MPITVMILGLPRSATTAVYKAVCRRAKEENPDTICLFEPTNHEALSTIERGVKHIHDTAGEVPYDYDRIPRSIFYALLENSRWHVEWARTGNPKTRFCGDMISRILADIDLLDKPVIIKDVHLWVMSRHLWHMLRYATFVFTVPSLSYWLGDILARFDRLPREWNTVYDKAGITKFYRYINNGRYINEMSKRAVEEEARSVYNYYLSLVHEMGRRERVYTVTVYDFISDEMLDAIARMVLG